MTSGNSIKILTQHYAYAKHAVFLAVTVGGVATPAINYCIVGIDFVEALFDSSTPKKIPYETGTVHRHFVGKCLSFTLQKVNVKLPYNKLNEKL